RDFHVTGVQTCALPISILDTGGPRGARGSPLPTGRGGRVRGRSPTGRGNRFRGGPVRVRIPPALRPGRRRRRRRRAACAFVVAPPPVRGRRLPRDRKSTRLN